MILLNVCVSYSKFVETDKKILECIDKYCRVLPLREVKLNRDIYGKPHINIKGTYLSVSHTTGIWVCVISNIPVGIDIESIHANVAKALILRFNNKECDNPILNWTKIESCSKLVGVGLNNGIDNLIKLVDSKRFFFVNPEISKKYICTICISADNNLDNLETNIVEI